MKIAKGSHEGENVSRKPVNKGKLQDREKGSLPTESKWRQEAKPRFRKHEHGRLGRCRRWGNATLGVYSHECVLFYGLRRHEHVYRPSKNQR